MADNKITLTVIVNGTAHEVEGNVNAPLLTIVEKALQQSNNMGQPIQNWELRDEPGNILDVNKKICEYGFLGSTKLFLSIKAGVGG